MDLDPVVRIVAFLVVLIPSIILHEVSHGVAALYFGDDTAKRAGRLTLNPVPHIDPFGSIILPAMLAFTSLGAFGWAKPVPVNPRRLRKPREQSLWVSLAGPATNIVLALVAAFVFVRLSPDLFSIDPTDGEVPFAELVFMAGYLNVVLAVFNLLPIPPLDGSALIERFLPARAQVSWFKFRQYSMGILLGIVLLVPSFFDRVFEPFVEMWIDLVV